MKTKYFAFSTDADEKLRYLNDRDFREVFCAVFENLRSGVEPEFDNYVLYSFYESVLSTPEYYLSRFDGRSVSSAENGKKGGRPPKNNADSHNDKVREQQQEERKKLVYERICDDPYKYCDGASWENITKDFDDIVPYPDRLRKAFNSLQDEGKIVFDDEGSKKYIKLIL